MTASNRNFGLDVVRAAAIGLVLLSHGRACLEASCPILKDFFVLGYLGVEIFFVLSGFLIGGILINVIKPGCSSADIRNFWIRRWFRTLPNYYLFLTVEFILAAAFVKHAVLSKFLLYPVFLQTFSYTVRPVYFSVSWSLAVEEWFYLLIPVALFACLKVLGSFRRSLIFTSSFVVVGLLALRFFYVFQFNADWGPDIRNTTILRLDSIMFGVIAAFLFARRPTLWERVKVPAFLAGAVVLVVNAIYLQFVDRDASLYARTLQFTVVPASIALCFPLLRTLRLRQVDSPKVVGLKWVVAQVSLWSYSLYLCHMIVLRFIFSGREALDKVAPGYVLLKDVGFFMVFLGVSLGISALTYNFFEKPMTSMRERFSRRERHSY